MKYLGLLFCFLPMVLFSQKKDNHHQALIDFLSKADHIELCELKPLMVIDTIFAGDSELIDTSYYFATIVFEDSIDLKRIGYKCEVSTKEVDSILLHRNSNSQTVLSCYNPRNGVLFYNEIHQVIGYLEICFQCYGTADYLIPEIWLDDEQREQFKELFLREGLNVE